MTSVAARLSGVAGNAGSDRALAGTGTLVRLILRRDRIRIPVWIAALVGITIWSASVLPDFYQSAAERQSRAELISSPAGTALSGPGYGLDDYTFGAMLANEMLGFVAIFVAIMNILTVARHTRAEEETGRAELVRSNVVGRYAHLTAALVVAAATNLVLGATMVIGLGVLGIETIDWVGSVTFGAAIAVVGLVFAAVAAVTVQITEYSRGANSFAFAVLGAAYVLRGVGDISNSALSWLSPIGWAQASRAYVDERWWPLVLAAAVAGGLIGVAYALNARRDLGAGLRRPGPGPSQASELLVHPLGLALRLHRGSLIGWGIGLFLFGVIYGSLAGDVESFIADNPDLQEWFDLVGGVNLVESWLSTIISMLAMVCSIYAVLAAGRLRSEETAGRAEPLLATGLSRMRWAGSHLTVALAGAVAMLVVSGLGLGISAAISVDDPGLLPRILGASLAYAPAVWLVVGVSAAFFGNYPRAIVATWAVVVYALVIGMLGGLLQFPAWMNDLSPFAMIPLVPAEDFTIVPLAGLSAVAALLIAAGLAGFRRRDLEAT